MERRIDGAKAGPESPEAQRKQHDGGRKDCGGKAVFQTVSTLAPERQRQDWTHEMTRRRGPCRGRIASLEWRWRVRPWNVVFLQIVGRTAWACLLRGTRTRGGRSWGDGMGWVVRSFAQSELLRVQVVEGQWQRRSRGLETERAVGMSTERIQKEGDGRGRMQMQMQTQTHVPVVMAQTLQVNGAQSSRRARSTTDEEG